MTLLTLTFKEIAYRRTGFILGMISVIIAVGVLVAEFTLLGLHDFRSEQILKMKEQNIREEMRSLEEDYRKITKDMGFNLLILPGNQNLGDLYAEGYTAKTMPELYAEKLAHAGIESIKHLLPCLEQKTRWPEKGNRVIILNGIRGEMPSSESRLEPILAPVPQGKMALGYEIWTSLNLKPGDRVRLSGEDLVIDSCLPQRGSQDDITVWVNLSLAQKMLGQEGRISAILALKCLCEGMNIEKIRKEITSVLPDTQVVEFTIPSLARDRARGRAKTAAEASLAAEKEHQSKMKREREKFISWFIPIMIVGGVVWTGLLFFANAKERKMEIAILSALGLQSKHILQVFLLKAMIMGFLGGLIGYLAGFMFGVFSMHLPLDLNMAALLYSPGVFWGSVVAPPLLCMMASLIPALLAAWQNPAEIFTRE